MCVCPHRVAQKCQNVMFRLRTPLEVLDDKIINGLKIQSKSTVLISFKIYKGNSEKYKGKIRKQDISIYYP